MNPLIRNRKKKIEKFCQAWNVQELLVFGSVTTTNFHPDSDIDFVVDFKPGSVHTLIDLAKMEEELERIFNRRIDLITRRAIEQSRNHIRKKAILSTMEQVYVA
ncbi:MAG: nucleotidyltransferase domain-containing protein [Methanoregula sp.]|nr:nucleotidyltransferase domain-containing protein [Methanoregula sp.]